jgi:purine-nucleoside phosphorylase
MSFHIEAKTGEIAENILLPGDPLRAKYIAETFLENAICYNNVRGMLGFTGYYKGKRVSVQGTGMGMPSLSIYAHELIAEYGVKNLIRVGSAGSYQPHVKLRDIVIAMAASSNANMNKHFFEGFDFAPTASFTLFKRAIEQAEFLKLPYHAGNVLSSDLFYEPNAESYKHWGNYGVLAVEMETAALYILAAKFKVNALGIFTVSDSLITKESVSSQEKESALNQMIQLALNSFE